MEHLKDYITVNNQQYYISTKHMFDVGFETMVFRSKNNHVVSWESLFYRHYKTENDAINGHNYVINNLEKCLKEGKTQNWAKDTGINPFDTKFIESIIKRLENMIERLEEESK